MPTNQSGQTDIVTPKVKIVTGSTTTELATAVDTQTNVLNKAMRIPVSGQTTGNVVNGTIRVQVISTAVNNNISTFQAAVYWDQWVTPS